MQLPNVEFLQHKNCFINPRLFKYRCIYSVCFVLFCNVLCVLSIFYAFYFHYVTERDWHAELKGYLT